MEEPEGNMSKEDVKKVDSNSAVKKPKKRSLVERELETSLTARVTSPATIADSLSTSRYGRARRLKTEYELIESQKTMLAAIKTLGNENTPVKVQSPVYRMHASNSPHKAETPKKALETYLDTQVDTIYHENIALSRFSEETVSPSPAKKFPKVYIRKDLIQNREADETIMLIKNLFSPTNSSTKSTNNPQRVNLDHSIEKINSKQNGHVDNASVVKTLDFDGNKKRKDTKDPKPVLSKNDLFELEAKCPYQVGDLAWARMGTFPFWPCIITRDPYSEMFVKKKLFGRVEHDIIHVTFFGDNGRRSWIVDNMLRNYLGLLEFEATRAKFTPEDKKKDPRLYAAFFVSEKKQALWNTSVEEAEILLREPKRLRIDIFNDMLLKFRASKKLQKSGKITRTDSDVSLSESLYDSLFSEEDIKTDDVERLKNKSRNKSFDVSEVVTACLDNMAAKTGITKIQRQSHMDRWLQKAKSKTPEKTQAKPTTAPLKVEKPDKPVTKVSSVPVKLDRKSTTNNKEKPATVPSHKPYRFRRRNESQSKFSQKASNKSKNGSNKDIIVIDDISNNAVKSDEPILVSGGLGVITKVEYLPDKVEDNNENTGTIINNDISENCIQPNNHLSPESAAMQVQMNELSETPPEIKQDNIAVNIANDNSPVSNQMEKQFKEDIKGSIEIKSNVPDHPETNQVSVMDIDEVTTKNSDQEKKEKCVDSETRNICAKEVQDDTHFQNHENSSSKSETVSSESVENNKVQLNDNNCIITSDTFMKEAQNVTIEASVTETNIEDTLNDQAEGGQPECNDKPKSSKNDSNTIFLDVSNSHSQNMVGKKNENFDLKKSIPPESPDKFDKIQTVENTNNISTIELINCCAEDLFLEEKACEKLSQIDSTTPEKPINNKEIGTIEVLNDVLNAKKCNKIQNAIDKTKDTSLITTVLENGALNCDNTDSFHEETHETLARKELSKTQNTQKYSKMEVTVEKSNNSSSDIIIPSKENRITNSNNEKCFEESEKASYVSSKKANLENQIDKANETDFFDDPNGSFSHRGSNNIFSDEHIHKEHLNDVEDELNKSGNSESILQICDETNNIGNVGCASQTPLNESNKSESFLDDNQINFNAEEDAEVALGISKLEDSTDSNNMTKENYENPTREYVESPTFTQLLESEEFFLDVNETCDSVKIHKHNEKGIDDEAIKEVENKKLPETHIADTNRYDEDEETSDDEPSPEYESFDEDTTEDFRKHMMSIENNITDKKDEELIVKICNEIAEKAKHSPTKYAKDVQVAKTKGQHETSLKWPLYTKEKLDPTLDTKLEATYRREKLVQRSQDQILDPTPKNKIETEPNEKLDHSQIKLDSNPKTKFDASPKDKLDTRSNKILDISPKKKLETNLENKMDINSETNIDTNLQNKPDISPENKRDKRSKKTPGTAFENKLDTSSIDKLITNIEKESKSKLPDEIPINDKKKSKPSSKQKTSDIKIQRILDKNDVKRIDCNKSDLIINGHATLNEISEQSSRIYRTRLSVSSVTKERASPDIKLEASEIKDVRKSCEYDPKVVIIRLESDNSGLLKETDNKPVMDRFKSKNNKISLSLKRKSPKSKPAESKTVENPEPEIKSEQPTNCEPILLTKKEDITLNKVPKKINIENDTVETTIPEPVKLNGFHHNDNRKYTDTPDLPDDTDFDIDAVSLNSEDSEISLANSIEVVPKRNLRSRPERTLENALKNTEFLKYLELRQDYLMDEHPELNEEEVVLYVYKTWQYEEDLKSDCKKIEEAHHLSLIKGVKQETPSRKQTKKSQPKNNLENSFREKYEKCRQTFDFDSENASLTSESCEFVTKQNTPSKSKDDSSIQHSEANREEAVSIQKTRSISPDSIDFTSESSNDVFIVKDKFKDLETVSVQSEESRTPKRALRSKTLTPKSLEKQINDVVDKRTTVEKVKKERDFDCDSIGSEDSEMPLRQLRSKVLKENKECEQETTPVNNEELTSEDKDPILEPEVKEERDETSSTVSDNEPLQKKKKGDKRSLENPDFVKYLELKQDALMDENPQLSQNEITSYLYKTWLYEENSKSDVKKNDELKEANIVKGLGNEVVPPKPRRRHKVEKHIDDLAVVPKEKPRRRTIQPYYNENYSDIEDELEVFEIFKTKKAPITVVSKAETEKEKVKSPESKSENVESLKIVPKLEEIDTVEYGITESLKIEIEEINHEVEYVDEIERYFTELTTPKPNVFKGLMRERVCDLCEQVGNLVKCKGCNGMFHPDCVKSEKEAFVEIESSPSRGRKKKRKLVRKQKSLEDLESHSDDKSHDTDINTPAEEFLSSEICTVDADAFETLFAAKMKEILETADMNYDSYSSDDGIDWTESVPGKCEIVDVQLKRRNAPIDYTDFKCNNCQKHNIPVCFVCKSAVSKTNVKMRQKCHVAHCYKYYHLECLDHWPQTQFNSGEPSRSNKKIHEFFEALTCPRHVCHTCVSDDPRGCKTRFSGDKLAKCVRCPATYHSFNKCLPAGSQVLTASHIICPRHTDPRPGKVPCHVNTGWCFICALGGSLICCEYCPTSFHAECLNIKPPEGNYMCEDCETGRLPLYGEMVWVKLGHYRWWPGKILHPSEIPENIMAVKHGLGDFVVRFFGQYDHYWVNRGRVFPYQEGDSGRISSQKSKIDADFTLAIEHAQRAYAILKNAEPNEEESIDIASSLLPPHYVKLKCNKPCGSLCGRKIEDLSNSLTQCECNPDEPEPCGLYSQCLNRMLLTECGPTCRAGERCNNRAFEKRLYPKLVPYRTPHRGWGLKTLEDIKAGQFVIEYVGELIDEEEFRRRMRRKHEIRDENFYFLTLDKERMIDAGPKGNAARFMNHCCEPNCETQKWTVLGDVRVGLFAIDDIPANSEVTFNYNLECAGIEKKRCLCGAKRCSGYIGAKPKQEESQTKKGKDGKVAAKRTYRKKKHEESSSTSKLKPKKPVGRPPKAKELTEIEKDLLIIKSATNVSSDESSRSQSVEDKTKTLKRKRVSISTDEVSVCNGQEPSVKKMKCEEKPSEVGD